MQSKFSHGEKGTTSGESIASDTAMLIDNTVCIMVKLEKLLKHIPNVFCANLPPAKEVEHLYLWSHLALKKKSADHKQL